MNNDYYAPWEWQPVENLPCGCVEIEVEYEDGTRSTCCSCDANWLIGESQVSSAVALMNLPVAWRLLE